MSNAKPGNPKTASFYASYPYGVKEQAGTQLFTIPSNSDALLQNPAEEAKKEAKNGWISLLVKMAGVEVNVRNVMMSETTVLTAGVEGVSLVSELREEAKVGEEKGNHAQMAVELKNVRFTAVVRQAQYMEKKESISGVDESTLATFLSLLIPSTGVQFRGNAASNRMELTVQKPRVNLTESFQFPLLQMVNQLSLPRTEEKKKVATEGL